MGACMQKSSAAESGAVESSAAGSSNRLRDLAIQQSATADMQQRQSLQEKLFNDVGIVQLVLSYVGPGNYFFLGTVCKLWHKLYTEQPACERPSVDWRNEETHSVSCSSRTTLASAVFASPACVQLAYGFGFMRYGDTSTLQQLAGKHADKQTLLALRAAGMRFQNPLLRGAADSADLSKLIWLYREQRCELLPDDITCRAAKCGSIEMLDWLIGVGCAVTAGTFSFAALAGHMHILKHLQRLYGSNSSSSSCAWNETTTLAAARRDDFEMLQWLCTAGCPWDSRTCDKIIERADVAAMSMLCKLKCPWIARCAAELGSTVCMQCVIDQVTTFPHNVCLSMYSLGLHACVHCMPYTAITTSQA
jgi:hypothetical protein